MSTKSLRRSEVSERDWRKSFFTWSSLLLLAGADGRRCPSSCRCRIKEQEHRLFGPGEKTPIKHTCLEPGSSPNKGGD
jgi:hypothetical protein